MGMVGVLCCCYVRRKCCTTNYKGKLKIAQFSSYTLKYMKCIGLSCYNSIHINVKGDDLQIRGLLYFTLIDEIMETHREHKEIQFIKCL